MFLVSQKMKYAELRLAGWPKCKICNFRGWFIIDLVAAIPFDLLLFGSDTDEVRTPGVNHFNSQTVLLCSGSCLEEKVLKVWQAANQQLIILQINTLTDSLTVVRCIECFF